jgi:tetratricopeptide (TPR) repeat protein
MALVVSASRVLCTTVVVTALAIAGAPGVWAAPQDVLAQARGMATSGHRLEAIKLLQDRLSASPDDLDARTLVGIIYSWEGRYDDARRELRRVLSDRPGYYDAMAALAYVELWAGREELALMLADATLRINPKDTSVMLARARAQSSLNRVRDAIDTLDRLLRIDPANDAAQQMRARLVESRRSWADGYGYGDSATDSDAHPATC